MIHIPQDRGSILDDLVAPLTFDVSHKPDTAVFVFELRIVQPVSFRSSEGGRYGAGYWLPRTSSMEVYSDFQVF